MKAKKCKTGLRRGKKLKLTQVWYWKYKKLNMIHKVCVIQKTESRPIRRKSPTVHMSRARCGKPSKIKSTESGWMTKEAFGVFKPKELEPQSSLWANESLLWSTKTRLREQISMAKKQTVINVKTQCMVKSNTKIQHNEWKKLVLHLKPYTKIIPDRLKRKKPKYKKWN